MVLPDARASRAGNRAPCEPRAAARCGSALVDLLRPIEGAEAAGIASALIAEFGSLPEVLAASPERQRRIARSERSVLLLGAVRRALRRVVTARLETRPVLSTSRDLHEYLAVHMAFEPVETVRVLFLDAARRLIADEEAGRGGPDEAPMYVRTILGRALELGATGIVVAHNHPSGSMHPSEADRLVTDHLSKASKIVGVVLVEHLIVTRNGCVGVVCPSDAAPTLLAKAGRRVSDPARPPDQTRSPSRPMPPDRLRPATENDDEDEDEDLDDRRLSMAIRGIVRLRRQRDALFPQGVFSEPCWNILLDVFACELEGSPVSVKSACLAAEVPISTGLRWIETLCARGVLIRWKDTTDRRRSFVRLTKLGRSSMVEFAALAGLDGSGRSRMRTSVRPDDDDRRHAARPTF